MADLGAIYRDTRERIIGLVAETNASTRVPACPEWTIKDLLAHMSGNCADVLAGNLDGVATDPWTAAQVDARRGMSATEIIEEWRTLGAQIDPLVQHFPGHSGAQLIFDTTTHEHDIRGALGRPGEHGSESVDVSYGFVALGLHNLARSLGLRVRLLPDDAEPQDAGEGEPAGELRGSRFEIIRVFAGRRTAAQVAALGCDPATFERLLEPTPFSLAREPVGA